MNDPTPPAGTRAGQPPAAVRRSAVLSPCGTYRYELARSWAAGPVVGWVMLNPSTADASGDDPTIRRCIAFAQAWGYGGLVVRNLYALRATDPAELARHRDPIGPDNGTHLARCVREALTVVAWGARGGRRGRDVLALLQQLGIQPHQLAATRGGQPRHPLYLKTGLVPVPVMAGDRTGETR